MCLRSLLFLEGVCVCGGGGGGEREREPDYAMIKV